MAGRKRLKAAQQATRPIVVEKESMPPEKAKQAISVASLFAQKHELRRKVEKDKQHILVPNRSGISKPHATSCTRRRSEDHPLFRQFKDATKLYRDGVVADRGRKLEAVCTELIAKVDELAVSGMPGQLKDVISGARVNDIAVEHARLTRPLGEDQIEIQRTRADGSIVAQECKLSDTMDAFQQDVELKRAELEQLLSELNDVEMEITAVKQRIAATEQNGVKKLKNHLDARSDALVKEAGASKEATVADVEKARKAEKKAAGAQNKAFEKFMRELF